MPLVSVLITGTACAGKTTLIDNLYDLLSEDGIPFRNKFDLSKTVEMRTALKMLASGDVSRQQDANYLLVDAYLRDAKEYHPHIADVPQFLLQDTYWERVIAFCETHGMPDVAERLVAHEPELYHFDIPIFLSADRAVRLERIRQRNRSSHPLEPTHIIEQMDARISGLVSISPNYLHIDTTHLTPKEVKTIAYAHIMERQ